ncbi:MAG: ABC transporter permease [Rhodospirillales bacterium]
MGTLLYDVRYGVRTLIKSRGFTAVAVLALALGIGANTAIFTVANAVLIRPLPYKDSDRLVAVWENNPPQGWQRMGVSGPAYIDWQEQSQLFEEIALYEPGSGTLTGIGEPEQIPGMRVTTNFFKVLGAGAQYGRLFTADEAKGGRHNVCVVTNGFWRRRMGSDPGVVGKVFQVDGLAYMVIGVLSPDFWLPMSAEAFVPWNRDELRNMNRASHAFGVLGRLKPGVTVEQASAELNSIQRQIGERYPGLRDWGATVAPMKEALVEYIRPALLVLLGAVGFVLLIACTNVANLLLARSAARRKEIAIRTAIGAGRWRLIRQFLTESVLLGLAGGALGLLFALWGTEGLSRVLPNRIPVPEAAAQVALARITVDARVLLFTLLISVATGALFGLAPALAALRSDTAEALKEGGRSSASGGGRQRLRGALVISEVALALVLLVSAALMIRSFRQMQKSSPGFHADKVLTAEMELPADSKYRDPRQWAATFERFLERMKEMPGVQSAALTHIVPLTEYESKESFEIEGRPALASGERLGADWRAVSPGYFRTLGIPLLRGRDFTPLDHADAPCVVVIDQTLARMYFRGEDPIGRRLIFERFRSTCEIAGVVGEVKHAGVNKSPRPTAYFAFTQAPQPRMSFVVRSAGNPAGLISAVKKAVWSVDRDQPVYNIKTMDDLLSDSASAARFTLVLLGVFAALALTLAAVGIYGVMSYTVNQRKHEIGIRIALGAQRGHVLRLVVGQAMALALAGVAAGLVIALAVTRLLATLLYGVSATDVPTFAIVAVTLSAVALAASYIPARRATRIEPLIALRYE